MSAQSFTDFILLSVITVLMVASISVNADEDLPFFDFTNSAVVDEWVAANHISSKNATPEGMEVQITDLDPYLLGPARDYPEEMTLWTEIRLWSEQGGNGQLFYYQDDASEEKSVRFNVPIQQWANIKVPLPHLGEGYHIRIDPPGNGGRAIIASLRFRERIIPKPPGDWSPPIPCESSADKIQVTSGAVTVNLCPDEFSCFNVLIGGDTTAIGGNQPLIGYLKDNEFHWIDVAKSARTDVFEEEEGRPTYQALFEDAHGAEWNLTMAFYPDDSDAVGIEVFVKVSEDRDIAYLPMLTVFPGVGSFGTQKNQGLFAGLEYLNNEPSSSEADIIGPESKRQVPNTLKITFPLMVVQAEGRYIALSWEQEPHLSALYDSPDRIFNSDGHVMGVIFPGSDGVNREEGSLLPFDTYALKAGETVQLKASLMGGMGENVIPAIQHYVRMRGIPSVPDPGMDIQGYAELTAAGWLDSKIREGSLYRHAVWPGFGPHAAADAPVFMEWLATVTDDESLAARLRDAAADALLKVAPVNYNFANVSHVPYPLSSLIHGHVDASISRYRESVEGMLARFEPDGRILYQPREGGQDYGRTHFEPDANGLTAEVVASVLRQATVLGDWELIERGIEKLRALDRFYGTVPRGAQTWEVPLHTPDILASANLVRAYVLGYELTGEEHFLQMAEHWAWTGVPFVYLINPTEGEVGPYSTIAVYGATSWVAPIWFGLPVQWCGLVYSDALYMLSEHSDSGMWKQLADGITVAGIQHTWPLSDEERKGLLPDFYHLRAQVSDGPAINPGTVQANAMRYYGQQKAYDMHVLRGSGLIVHAPGEISDVLENADGISFLVKTWLERPGYVLISGLRQLPEITKDGQQIGVESPHQYLESGHLVLQISGNVQIGLQFTGE